MCFGGGTENCEVLGREKGRIGVREGGGMCLLKDGSAAFSGACVSVSSVDRSEDSSRVMSMSIASVVVSRVSVRLSFVSVSVSSGSSSMGWNLSRCVCHFLCTGVTGW